MLNPRPINAGATKKNYARVLKSKTFQQFGLWIESPDVHSHPNTSGAQFEPDFHTLGHGSIGGEVSPTSFALNHKLMVPRWLTR
jgi:hypothetical protein